MLFVSQLHWFVVIEGKFEPWKSWKIKKKKAKTTFRFAIKIKTCSFICLEKRYNNCTYGIRFIIKNTRSEIDNLLSPQCPCILDKAEKLRCLFLNYYFGNIHFRSVMSGERQQTQNIFTLFLTIVFFVSTYLLTLTRQK